MLKVICKTNSLPHVLIMKVVEVWGGVSDVDTEADHLTRTAIYSYLYLYLYFKNTSSVWRCCRPLSGCSAISSSYANADLRARFFDALLPKLRCKEHLKWNMPWQNIMEKVVKMEMYWKVCFYKCSEKCVFTDSTVESFQTWNNFISRSYRTLQKRLILPDLEHL